MKSSFTKGKAIFLVSELMQFINPACKDLGYAEEGICVIYIGIQCNEQSNDCLS